MPAVESTYDTTTKSLLQLMRDRKNLATLVAKNQLAIDKATVKWRKELDEHNNIVKKKNEKKAMKKTASTASRSCRCRWARYDNWD